jgi:FAD:protein FMN transferase
MSRFPTLFFSVSRKITRGDISSENIMKKLFSAVVVLLFISCGNETPKATVLQGNAFGTTYNIQYYSKREFNAEKGIDSMIHRVNRSVSTYIPNSDISKINRGDSTVVVDAIFKEVYRISEVVFTNSKGFFDPTIGVLRNAYGFGDEKPLELMDSITLDSLRMFVGFRKVEITAEGTVKKKHPQIYLDFNAVAKGYGVDRLGAYLESEGVTDYIIELGGEILAGGTNLANDNNWIAGIEAVDSKLEDRSYTVTVELKDKGMASSGNYRKYRIDRVSGKRYVHTINPLTGKAEQGDVTSATVIASTCALADAYATAFMAMGFKKSKQLLAELPQIEAYLTLTDDNNESQVFVTSGFKKILME